MVVESTKPDRSPHWLGSNLFLGLLVTVLSVSTAVANYSTYKAGANASGIEGDGDRLLANSNTEYISASQYIIVDYTMYDNYYVNLDVDEFAADYYQSQFSDELQASLNRDAPFDDQYYTEMYATAGKLFDDAFTKIDESNALKQQESGFQFVMLISAVGLSFAAYASLLEEENRLRKFFAIMSLIALALSIWQFIIVTIG